MKVFAHRGFSGLYPENTMLAFEKALEVGADGVELDVHLTKDGKLVVIHDEALARTTGYPGLISDYTLEALTKIKASKTKEDRYEAYIPSFEEYCRFASDNKLITNIEIKTNRSWYCDIEKMTLEMVKAYKLEERVIFSSFNWLSISRMRILAPHLPCGLLYEDQNVRHLAYQAKDGKFNYLHPDFTLLEEEAVKECKELGIGLNVWTINSEERMQKLIDWKVDGVISNYPDMCLKLLGR